MGQFSSDMRKMAQTLIKEFGNDIVITRTDSTGQYDPTTGETTIVTTDVPTYAVDAASFNREWGNDGQNTNLAGFDDNAIVVAWIPALDGLDETWSIDGGAIRRVAPTKVQNDIIIYEISLHKG